MPGQHTGALRRAVRDLSERSTELTVNIQPVDGNVRDNGAVTGGTCRRVLRLFTRRNASGNPASAGALPERDEIVFSLIDRQSEAEANEKRKTMKGSDRSGRLQKSKKTGRRERRGTPLEHVDCFALPLDSTDIAEPLRLSSDTRTRTPRRASAICDEGCWLFSVVRT